jgi:hypothetical protein
VNNQRRQRVLRMMFKTYRGKGRAHNHQSQQYCTTSDLAGTAVRNVSNMFHEALWHYLATASAPFSAATARR